MPNHQLERILEEGNKPPFAPYETYKFRLALKPSNIIECRDGFRVSVIAGVGAYCYPRPALMPDARFPGEVAHDYPGPYGMVEVGMPSERPEPWVAWEAYAEDPNNPTGTVYGHVTADMIRALIDSHGGERPSRATEPIDQESSNDV